MIENEITHNEDNTKTIAHEVQDDVITPESLESEPQGDMEHSTGQIEQNEPIQDNQEFHDNNGLKNVLNAEFNEIDNIIKQDIETITLLYKQGKISAQEALGLKEHIELKAREDREKVLSKLNNIDESLALEAFKQEQPEFFSSTEKLQVVEHLKALKGKVSKEDLHEVARIVQGIENAAISKFQQMHSQNKAAKNKLNSVAQNKVQTGITPKRIFSRQEISSMSTDQFMKHQADIEAQMRDGLIK